MRGGYRCEDSAHQSRITVAFKSFCKTVAIEISQLSFHRLPLNSTFSPCTHRQAVSFGVFVSEVVAIAPRLSRVRLDAVKIMLLMKMQHKEIAEIVKCSISSIQKISRNIRVYGEVHAPKLKKQGRPPLLTGEIREV